MSKIICTVSKLSFKDKDETIEMGKRGEIWAGVCVGVCVWLTSPESERKVHRTLWLT